MHRPRLLIQLVACGTLAVCLLLAGRASAEVVLPAIFSDNLCLQAGKTVPVWGLGSVGEKVTVAFAGQEVSATADKDGRWMATLAPLKATDAPTEMVIRGSSQRTIKNVIVGEVWLCSGQSNMEFTLSGAHNAATAIPKAKYPSIRLFTVTKATALTPQAGCAGQWVECTPQTAPSFSAVGYFFGRDLFEATKQPVGLIHSSWGGTPAQAWTSLEALEVNAQLKGYAQGVRKLASDVEADRETYKSVTLPKWEAEHKQWEEQVGKAYREKLSAWNEAVKSAKAEGKPSPAKPKPERAEPQRPTKPGDNAGMGSVLYNGMIAPLIPYAMRGVIWYQGESNAGEPDRYAVLFPAMIENWRHDWAEKAGGADTHAGDFAFLFVQLANFMEHHADPADTQWARLREAQTKTLSLPKTGMAVIIDIGQSNDIHPRDKMDVGHRLFLNAEKISYGKDVVPAGPLFEGALKVEGDKARVSFKNVGGGLTIAAAPSTRPSVPPEAALGELKGFAVAGPDHHFVWAQAKIDGNSVVVWSDAVKEPAAVRYGWDDDPQCNLYNKEGLPASPFRTDDWAMGEGTGAGKH